MAAPGLSDEVALRIGLAARELPGTDNRQVLDILITIMGKPITVRKLSRLRFNLFKRTLEKHRLPCASGDDIALRKAMAFLKGKGIQCEPSPLPIVIPYREGDIPDSIRIACSSDNGHMIDGQFATCKHYLIYQVAADSFRLIDIRIPDAAPKGLDKPKTLDKHSARASLLEDCHVLCTTEIGGLAASKVVKAGIHPIKLEQMVPAVVFIREIQQVLKDSPPPWLAKAMAKANANLSSSQNTAENTIEKPVKTLERKCNVEYTAD